MTELLLYTTAVSTRKARAISQSRVVVNHAVLAQMEEDDIPRLLEIVRIQDRALRALLNEIDDDSDEYRCVYETIVKTEELAEAGSKSQWGEYEPGN